MTGATLVVQPDAAAPQLVDEATERLAGSGAGGKPPATAELTLHDRDAEAPVVEALRRFYAVAKLDPERYQRDFAKLAAEVIANLAGYLGTDIEISVEVKATNSGGFPDHVTRTVTENARTLKLDAYGFETD